jgi:membrane-bound lytic murein transglycosylase F
MARRWIYVFLLSLLIPLASCGAGSSAEDRDPAADLSALLERGTLRVVVPGTRMGEPALPRRGSPVGYQRELAEAFAKSLGLEMELVPVFRLSEMLPALQQGKADIIAANLTVTPARQQRVDFTQAIDHVHEVVIVADGNPQIQTVADLAGRSVMVDPASAFWETLEHLALEIPGLRRLAKPMHLDDEDVLDLIANGQVDATIRDGNVAEMYVSYRSDVRIAFPIGERQSIAWAVRQETPQLLAAINQFLATQNLLRPLELTFTGDLPEILERRRLRIILPNTAASYFLWRGELVGFEYEFARRFASEHGLRLEVIVPPDPGLALQWIEEGRADIAGGFLERKDSTSDAAIAYTRPWHHAQPLLLARADSEFHPKDWESLEGAVIAGSPNCSAWAHVRDQAGLYDLHLHEVQGAVADAEAIVNRLVAGEFDYVIVEHHLAAIELARRDDIVGLFPVGDRLPQAWGVRATSPELLAALDEFFHKEHRSEFHNILYRRYFEDERRIRWQQREVLRGAGDLSAWDAVVRRYAEEKDFDWRLVVAQMYQESRFDPEAKSRMGALGLMQIMPLAAQQVGVSDIELPENNIRAGVLYLDWVRQRFSEDIPFADRMWFTLAAYNAGLGHVLDARRLAAQKGWDPDRWFDNVESAMLLLSRREYYSKSRHGYVRGSEPVAYVRNIRDRYAAYVQMVEAPVSPLFN